MTESLYVSRKDKEEWPILKIALMYQYNNSKTSITKKQKWDEKITALSSSKQAKSHTRTPGHGNERKTLRDKTESLNSCEKQRHKDQSYSKQKFIIRNRSADYVVIETHF